MPSLALSPVIVSEGHSGSTPATLTVTLSATSSQTVTVNYTTGNGTAPPAAITWRRAGS